MWYKFIKGRRVVALAVRVNDHHFFYTYRRSGMGATIVKNVIARQSIDDDLPINIGEGMHLMDAIDNDGT
jgi:hypothetical protein